MSNKKRINELVSLITNYQKSYYSGNEEVSDAQFDLLWDELTQLDPNNPILKKVGSDVADFPKVRHIMGMGSQSKCSNEEQFLDWAQSHSYSEYLVEYKLDGASLELQYKNGSLLRAITRGDGIIGDDITNNARLMQGVIGTLPFNFTGAIRGEVLMTHKIKDEYFSDTKNCRNAAAGLMKRKDKASDCRHLTLIVYDALDNSDSNNVIDDIDKNNNDALITPKSTAPNNTNNCVKYFNDEVQKIDFLKKCGFVTSPLAIFHSVKDVIDYRSKVDSLRSSLDYDIDGLVIKPRNIDITDSFLARPDKQVAFKFSLDEATTTLKKVEWNQNGATLTPVAIFDPVALCGTRVTRASLCNPDTIKSLGVYIGSTIVVVKRGEIIPKVERVVNDLTETNNSNSNDDYNLVKNIKNNQIEIPQKCPTCNTPLTNIGTRLFCPNQKCPSLLIHKIHKWASVTDILELGDVLIQKLVTTGAVQQVSDIYTLTEEKLRPYFLQDASTQISLGAKRVVSSINNSRKMTLATFLAALDIEGIGKLLCEKIVAAGFNTLPKVFNATDEEIASIMGFAEIMAHTFTQGIFDNKNQIEILTRFITIDDVQTTGKLRGKSFCFTGSLNNMTRDEAQKRVISLGGTCKTSVTKDLTYLVTNDPNSNSSKNKKAREYGTKIINEVDFQSIIN